MHRQTMTRTVILLSFLIATVTYAANGPPNPDPDTFAWKIIAGLCSILLSVVGAILWKIDKNQTELFALHGEHQKEITRVDKELVEIRTGIEYCEPCNAHRHRRHTDKEKDHATT